MSVHYSYLSYWERDAWFNKMDVAVIGGGIVGLTTALFIKQHKPNWQVAVLERGFLPHGATSRNAGFSCFGSPGEILSDIKKVGKEKAYRLVKDRFDGLASLLQLHHPDEIGYENLGGHEVFGINEKEWMQECIDFLPELNKELGDVLHIKANVYHLCEPDKSAQLGMKHVAGMLFCPWEGQLHSGLLIQSLIKKCSAAGVHLMNGIEVKEWTEIQDGVTIHAQPGIEWRVKKLVIATNGLTRQILPEAEVLPARGQVMVTQPIPGLKLKGTFHHHEGYNYFRNIGDRILLGGGRHLDPDGETTFDMNPTPLITEYLQELLKHMILPDRRVETDIIWGGLMGLGDEKSPIVKKISNHVTMAVRMGGMGVALGTGVARRAASLVMNEI